MSLMKHRKRQRKLTTGEQEIVEQEDLGSMMCQMKDEKGVATGPKMILPLSATPKQLDELLCSMLEDEEAKTVPYAFFVGAEQISASVAAYLLQRQKAAYQDKMIEDGRRYKQSDIDNITLKVPEEEVLEITYRPQAVFRIRPITRCSSSLDGHSEAVLVVAFSPDGQCLASGSGDTTIRLWDINTQTPSDILEGHKHWVQVLSWSPNAKFLVSGSREGALLCWTHEEYSKCKSTAMRGHRNWVSCVAWEPMHVNAKCDRFVSSSKDGSLKVWRATTGAMEFTLSCHTAGVTCVKWGGAGQIYSSSQDKMVIVWSAQNGAVLHQLSGHGHWVNFIALNTDLVIRSGAFDHEMRKFDTETAAQAYAKERYDKVVARAGTEMLVSCSDDNTMFLFKPLESPKPITRMTGHQGIINHIAFSPDGTMFASCSFDKSIKLWHADDGKFITTLRGHVAPVYHVSWSLDSRMLVSGSKDTTLKLWSATERKFVEDLTGHADEIFSTDWSPDGQCVATGSKDKKVRIWVH